MIHSENGVTFQGITLSTEIAGKTKRKKRWGIMDYLLVLIVMFSLGYGGYIQLQGLKKIEVHQQRSIVWAVPVARIN